MAVALLLTNKEVNQMKRMLMLSLSVIAGLSLFIAQIATVGACPPLGAYQPEVPASLKK